MKKKPPEKKWETLYEVSADGATYERTLDVKVKVGSPVLSVGIVFDNPEAPAYAELERHEVRLTPAAARIFASILLSAAQVTEEDHDA